MQRNTINKSLAALLIGILGAHLTWAQVSETETRYFRIGSLQSHISAYGSERAWNNVYYEGLRWPADYLKQDNSVIKRAWVAVRDFTDASGKHWDYWGTGINTYYVRLGIFPVSLKQASQFEIPAIFVDGNNIVAAFLSDVDEIDPTLPCDRVITNVVNTAIGLTMTQEVYVTSQPYHDNYIIKKFTYTNTGYVNYDPVQVLNDTLRGVRVGWGTRYQCGREGADATDGNQTWGKYTWVTIRGEDYPAHATQVLTEADGPVQWLRCAMSWFGQSERVTAYDNIGAPLVTKDGRLASPHFVGTVILHVDKSAKDKSDNPYQPAVLGWHAGDTYPGVGDLKETDEPKMMQLYDMLSGVPYNGSTMGATAIIGNPSVDVGRMWEKATGGDILKPLCPYTIHGDGGGTNQWITYGPWDLAPGESVTIVEAEGVSGLSRKKCEEVGRAWKLAKDNPNNSYNVTWKDGTVKPIKYSDKSADQYKNEWVYTGMDSLLLTFSRAKRNYDNNFAIPQAPRPPIYFSVESGGDRIRLTWGPSPSESDAGFAGYRVYRAVGKADTVFDFIAELPKGTYSYDDVSAVRGYSYYYYLTAVNDGSNNSSGVCNPTGRLESSRFYTRTTEPAYLQRQQGVSLKGIRVVPNPYNIKAYEYQYPKEKDKIMFLNIPGQCIIKIYTERGDLIQTIKHTNGTGDETWKLNTSSRQVVVSGIYIAYIEVTEDIRDMTTGELLYRKGDHTTRKILVVR